MATNPPKGDGPRHGSIRERSLAGSPEKDANNSLTWLPQPSKILLNSMPEILTQNDIK